MNDTPQHLKELQLKIWLSKTPGERLKQFMEDNASLFQFWTMTQKSNQETPGSNTKFNTDNDINNTGLPVRF